MQILPLATLLLTIASAFTTENSNCANPVSNASIPNLDGFTKFSHIAETANKARSTWQARANEKFNFSEDYIAALTSLQIDDAEFDQLTALNPLDIVQAAANATLPVNFTAAEKWPQCAASINAVFDQSYCGSCWAVSTATALSDRRCIQSNGADTRRVSAQDLLECASVLPNGCNGGSTVFAYNRWVSAGVCTGDGYLSTSGCKGYQFPPCSDPAWARQPACRNRNTTLTCRQSCGPAFPTPFATDRAKGKSTYRIIGGEEAIMREIFANGSVTVSMIVYQDFMTYKTGVYVYTSGLALGGHAIKMIGWGVEKGVKYWLCVNSWGKYWGDKGTFKILRGVNHMSIESYVVAGLF